MKKKHSMGVMLVFGLVGCATGSDVPAERISSANNAVRAAEQSRSTVSSAPDADHHLQLAREALTRAKDAEEDGEERAAELLYIRARADAELAQALAMASKAEADKNAAVSELDRVKREPGFTGSSSQPQTKSTETKSNETTPPVSEDSDAETTPAKKSDQ